MIRMRYLSIVLMPLLTLLSSAQSPPTPAEQVPRFEVASVKPITPQAAAGRSFRTPPGGFTSALPVAQLVPMAYQLDSYRVVGLPAWTTTELYEINAKRPAASRSGELWLMLRHLLEDRFSLRVHRETRAMPVYALVKARTDGRLGSGLRPVTRACDAKTADVAGRCSTRQYPGTHAAAGAQWEDVRELLEVVSGRPLVDETGLSGQFDVELEWNPELAGIPDGITGVSLSDLEARPIFVTAVREQLGLRLEPRTAPIEVLVIDSIERPAPD